MTGHLTAYKLNIHWKRSKMHREYWQKNMKGLHHLEDLRKD